MSDLLDCRSAEIRPSPQPTSSTRTSPGISWAYQFDRIRARRLNTSFSCKTPNALIERDFTRKARPNPSQRCSSPGLLAVLLPHAQHAQKKAGKHDLETERKAHNSGNHSA